MQHCAHVFPSRLPNLWLDVFSLYVLILSNEFDFCAGEDGVSFKGKGFHNRRGVGDGSLGNISIVKCLPILMGMARMPEYYILNALLPCFALGFMEQLVFLIPVASGERVSTIMLVPYYLILSVHCFIGTQCIPVTG